MEWKGRKGNGRKHLFQETLLLLLLAFFLLFLALLLG